MRLQIALLALLVTACSTIERTPVPERFIDDVTVDGFHDIRFWGDTTVPAMDQRVGRLLDILREQNSAAIESGTPVEVNFLAISGGGGNGAFGAGLLNGWTQLGNRPSFRIVSGVSTGAITAPFAFLGGAFDEQLRRAYTETAPGDIYQANILANLFAGPALADATPLESLIASFATEEMLAAIAEEHAKGRRLYVTTTNLDAGRPVVWDMGAIAASGNPGALDVFRRIILASASLPGLFPPVQIDVTENGQHYQELHVDGGLTAQVYAYHPQVELGSLLEETGIDVVMNVYVIWNGRSTPAYFAPAPTWYDIIERSIDIQFNHQGIGDVRRIYELTKRDGAEFRLAIIPSDFEEIPAELFETDYMRALFEVGEHAAGNGGLWLTEPP